jgi:putative hydrolase of the HAD superfamily
MTERHGRTTVFVDADNTLWDTDAVFGDAQSALLTAVEVALGRTADAGDRLAYLRAIDQAIAHRHHAGLRYPPRLLVRATELALGGIAPDAAARAVWRGGHAYCLSEDVAGAIEQRYFADLARAPALRLGVHEGLATLKEAGCLLLIVTEGAKVKAERNAELVGVMPFFERVVEGTKAPELYRRILLLTGAPSQAFMIGDQLDRDIAPAKAAGLKTIYFPGGFRPRWTPDETVVQPDHIVRTFDEVPPIILASGANSAASMVSR